MIKRRMQAPRIHLLSYLIAEHAKGVLLAKMKGYRYTCNPNIWEAGQENTEFQACLGHRAPSLNEERAPRLTSTSLIFKNRLPSSRVSVSKIMFALDITQRSSVGLFVFKDTVSLC